MMYDVCFWCKQAIEDAREESGANECDWAVDGDFGCDANPLSGEDGVGPHNSYDQVVKVYIAAQGIS